jgi:hypothetical protein
MRIWERIYKDRNLVIVIITQLIIISSFLLTGCEKEVKLNLPSHVSEMVVEGWIEQGKAPRILLSLTVPYFIKIDSNNLRDYAVTAAKVTVISESGSEILTLKPNDVYFPPYVYFGTEMTGETNQTYQLNVSYKGKVITAVTSIPELVRPDSVWFQLENGSDSLGIIGFRLKDNPSKENYYRTLTKRLGKDKRFVPTYTSVFNDKTFNGKTLNLTLSRGSSSILDIENDRFFSVGDTVVLQFCSIDQSSYEFWNTIQSQIITSANPFASSNARVKSNINGGIGIWAGYAVSYDTIIAK